MTVVVLGRKFNDDDQVVHSVGILSGIKVLPIWNNLAVWKSKNKDLKVTFSSEIAIETSRDSEDDCQYRAWHKSDAGCMMLINGTIGRVKLGASVFNQDVGIAPIFVSPEDSHEAARAVSAIKTAATSYPFAAHEQETNWPHSSIHFGESRVDEDENAIKKGDAFVAAVIQSAKISTTPFFTDEIQPYTVPNSADIHSFFGKPWCAGKAAIEPTDICKESDDQSPSPASWTTGQFVFTTVNPKE